MLDADLSAQIRDLVDELFRDSEAAIAQTAASLDHQVSASQMRVNFIEKLILLDTGTFALSLTFLSGIGSHSGAAQVAANIWWLYSAWIMLLVAIFAGAVHNWLRSFAVERSAAHVVLLGLQHQCQRNARMFRKLTVFFKDETTLSAAGVPIDGPRRLNEIGEQGTEEVTKAFEDTARKLKNLPDISPLIRVHVRLELLAVVLTALALITLACFLMRTSWVLLQK